MSNAATPADAQAKIDAATAARIDVWVCARDVLLIAGACEVDGDDDSDASLLRIETLSDMRSAHLGVSDDENTVLVGIRQATNQCEGCTSLTFGLIRLEFPYPPSKFARKFSDLVAAAEKVAGGVGYRKLGHLSGLPSARVVDERVDEVVERSPDVLDCLTDDDGDGWVAFDLKLPRRFADLGVITELGGSAI